MVMLCISAQQPTEHQTEVGSTPVLSAQSDQSQSILAQHMNWESVAIAPEPIARASTQPMPAMASTPPMPALATTPPPQPAPAATSRALSTPRRTPRRRQRQRRVVPMSADTARRALVNMSEERVRLDERRNLVLESLILELREIKDIKC